jgi:hypothetical protein
LQLLLLLLVAGVKRHKAVVQAHRRMDSCGTLPWYMHWPCLGACHLHTTATLLLLLWVMAVVVVQAAAAVSHLVQEHHQQQQRSKGQLYLLLC